MSTGNVIIAGGGAAGGLAKKGVVTTDADAGEGIYTLNATAAFNFTLPAATGTQERRLFVVQSASATNTITIKPFTGESLNGTINGSQAIDTTGDIWLAIDEAAGQWTIKQIGAAGLLNNFVATTAPITTSDSAAGYDIGSRWLNTTDNKMYVCVDATAGAAVWTLDNGGSITQSLTVTAGAAAWDTAKGAYATVSNGAALLTINAPSNVEVGRFYTLDILNSTAGASIAFSGGAYLTMDQSPMPLMKPEVNEHIVLTFVGITSTTMMATNYKVVMKENAGVAPTGTVTPTFSQHMNIGYTFAGNGSTLTVGNAFAAYKAAFSGQPAYLTFVNTGTDNTVAWGTEYLDRTGATYSNVTVAGGSTRRFRLLPNPSTAQFIVEEILAASPEPSRTVETITQTAHGFIAKDAIYHNGTIWVKAIATAENTSAQGIVTNVVDVNTFEVTTHGPATITGHGLTAGSYYFLDQATAGALTPTKPTTGIAQSVLHVRDVNTIFVDAEQPIDALSVGTPTALGRVSAFRTTNANLAVGNSLPMETVSVTTNISEAITTTGLVTLTAGKTYRLGAGIHMLTTASGFSIWYIKTSTGTIISGQINTESLNAATNNGPLATTEVIYTPTATVDVGLYLDSGNIGDAGAGSYFLVEELPSASIIPGAGTSLTRVSARQNVGGAFGGGGYANFDTIDLNDGMNQTISADGLVTLVAGKTYKISAGIRLKAPGIDGVQTWYMRRSTDGARIGGELEVFSNNIITRNAILPTLEFIVTIDATTAGTYGLWKDATSTLNEFGTGSFMVIEELPTTQVINPSQISISNTGAVGDSLIITGTNPSAATWKQPKVKINAITSSYTLGITDDGGMVTMNNATGSTVFVPADASVNFEVGTTVAITQLGTQTVQILPEAGATVHAFGGFTTLSGQYATASLTKIAANTWILVGSLV